MLKGNHMVQPQLTDITFSSGTFWYDYKYTVDTKMTRWPGLEAEKQHDAKHSYQSLGKGFFLW